MKIRRLSENLFNAQKTLKIPNVKEEKNAKKKDFGFKYLLDIQISKK